MNSEKDKKIAIVTGAAGFIGSHAVDLLLEKGFEVRGIDNISGGRLDNLDSHRSNPDFGFELRDIRDIEKNDSLFRDADYVFHFAGLGDIVPSIEKPVDYVSTNLMGTIKVLEASRQSEMVKFIYAASSSCYGLATQLPTNEDAPIDPKYPYALSKYFGEQAVLHWGSVYHMKVNSIRIFNAYGPRSRTTGAYGAVFGVFLAQKLAGKPFTVVGDGTQRRDFVYATDVANAFHLVAILAEEGEVYNLGSGEPQSVNRLVALLKGDVVNVPKRTGEPDITWADYTKLKSSVGWKPNVTFEEGVESMIQQIEYWKDAPIWDTDSIKDATKIWFETLSED